MGCGSSSPAQGSAPVAPKKHHHRHHHAKKPKAANQSEPDAADEALLAGLAKEEPSEAASEEQPHETRDIGNFCWPAVTANFDEWAMNQLLASPKDEKDSENHKYITFTELPPFTNKHSSLMCKLLTEEMFNSLKEEKTALGFTLSNAIQAGALRPRIDIGFVCGDEECYEVFQDALNPIISEIHQFAVGEDVHASDLDASKVTLTEQQASILDTYVISTRARGVRNISGFALPAGTLGEERLAVEMLLTAVFDSFPDELQGEYLRVGDLNQEQAAELQEAGRLFCSPDKAGALDVVGASGSGRDWPEGRGVYMSENKVTMCWVNEEDHCKVIAMQEGSDVLGVFARYCQLSAAVEEGLNKQEASLMRSEAWGYLTTCPSNVGTGLKLTMQVELPVLTRTRVVELERRCTALGLVLDGSAGKGSPSQGCRWQISNRKSLGCSEVDIVQRVVDGVLSVIEMEREAAAEAGADA